MGLMKNHFNKMLCWQNVCSLILFCVAATLSLSAQTFNTLVTFNSTNGSNPTDSLVQGIDGNLYGTTSGGGLGAYNVGWGTAFKVSTHGTLTTIYNFCSLTTGVCPDGSAPIAGLTLGADGNFYGTTSTGAGNTYCNESSRCGTAFKMTPAGVLTTLYDFCAQYHCSDGENPMGTLVQAANGSFYGTTSFGTDNANSGAIYRISPSGKFAPVYDFCSQTNCADGWDPVSGLVQASDGNLYGTAIAGGVDNCATLGCGTIFKITPAGQFSTVYDFCAQGGNPCPDGENPIGSLIQGSDGNFYGTTSHGGSGTWGTVFKITPAGILTTLYSFCSQTNCSDGSYPAAALTLGTDGNFYGTTQLGGFPGCRWEGFADGCGTIFKITPTGALTTLYRFCHQKNCPDGEFPEAALVQATDGNFYGTTYFGGMANCPYTGFECGTIYRLSVGLKPFVSLPQPSGKAGQVRAVLGQGFAGTTAVYVNGTPANFAVGSNTYIRITVPTGATTGFVTVTAPSGTLQSNVPFQVTP